MNKYPKTVKRKLMTLISEMSENPAIFVKNPGKDFTRKRKLPFDTVVKLLISMGGNSVYKELLDAQGYDANTVTTSAFIQQRDKILPDALEFLLHEFTNSFADIKKYRGYRLLANDGSDLHISTDPLDSDTYFKCNHRGNGHNLLHLNAMYDLCSRLYVDTLIQPGRHRNEYKALVNMVDRSRISGKVILIADRGYESYNNFAHIEKKGWNYLIRVKDLGSNGILSALSLPNGGEFDVCVRRILTRKQTGEIKSQPETYRFIPASVKFDFLDLHKNKFYPITFRVVRFEIAPDSYETVITNLDESGFSPAELKKLYAMRWGIETSFRQLKYAVGLINFHSKKREHITQEIFARIIMHNFTEMIISHVVISQADRKLIYQVNFTTAIHICRFFLRSRGNAPPPDIEALIGKNILPVRPGRKAKRKIRNKTTTSFLYRIA